MGFKSSLATSFPDSHLENPTLPDEQHMKVLGLQWVPLMFSPIILLRLILNAISATSCLTSRTILTRSVSTHITFQIKLYLKELWKLGYDWDSPAPNEFLQSWENFSKQLSSLTTISLPRFLFSVSTQLRLGFFDASEKGYAAVIYHIASTDSEVKLI